jgi:hypothetical protein
MNLGRGADDFVSVDRLEASRKYLFGSLGVLGTNNNSLIEGVLLARGTDIKPVVDVAPDFESYNYERLDLEIAEHKSYFEAALAWDLEVDGKKWADGKNVSNRIPLCRCRPWADRGWRLYFSVQVNYP